MSKPLGAMGIAHIYLFAIIGIFADKSAAQYPLSLLVKAQRLPTT